MDNSLVDVKVVGGKLVVASVVDPELTLDRLLSDVHQDNLHRDVSMSPGVESEDG